MNRAPLRVLMTTDAVGGVWTYAMQLCRALPDVAFTIANMGPSLSTCRRMEALNLANVRLFEGKFALEWEDDPWGDVERAGVWLLELADRVRPDVVHLNGYVHATLPWPARVMVVAHSCVLSWWRAVKRERAPARWNRYAREVRDGLHAAQLVVAPTREMAGALAYHYGYCGVRVIPNGCDEREFAVPADKENIVLCAARLWDEAKDIRCLANAAAGLTWPVVLAGDTGERDSDWKNLVWAGECDRQEMVSWFQRAGIYAHPACYEPFGLAPLEAALAGCALVLSDIPSLREVWGSAALYVTPGDVTAWRSALQRLIDEIPVRVAIAKRCRERALKYTPQRMAAAHLDCYRHLSLHVEPMSI